MSDPREEVLAEHPRAIVTSCYSMYSSRMDRYVIYDNATGKNLSREKRTIKEAWRDALDLKSSSNRPKGAVTD
jgi:hypothetical protein